MPWDTHRTADGVTMPYAPPVPARAARVDWPVSFGQRFIVTIDTEEAFDWSAPFARTGHSTEAITALPAAHRRFAEAGVPLIYLVDYPIATDPRAGDIFRTLLGDGVSSIGAQLHPWVNPPFDEPLSPANSFAGNLPPALEAAKLDDLGEAIARVTGGAPRIYRAGRYGIGPNTLGLLAARGYRVDSSMRAGYDYRGKGGPDFGAIGNAPFRCGPGDALIELPLTTVYTGRWRAGGEPRYRRLGRLPRAIGLAARMGLLARVSLTPEAMPLADALEAVRIALGEGERLLNLSFHSPSLVPGNTPYVRSDADLDRFHRWWGEVLALLAARAAMPVSLAELIAAAG